jgi:hypothetical protein
VLRPALNPEMTPGLAWRPVVALAVFSVSFEVIYRLRNGVRSKASRHVFLLALATRRQASKRDEKVQEVQRASAS